VEPLDKAIPAFKQNGDYLVYLTWFRNHIASMQQKWYLKSFRKKYQSANKSEAWSSFN